MTGERGRLDGQVAIGTGKAISTLFAREGARVVLVDKYEDRAKETLALIDADGGDATIVTADLSDAASYQYIVDEAVAHYGTVDILVNNAAVSSSTSILDTTSELYGQILAVNLTAPFFLTRAVMPLMIEAGGGSIVNIMSIAAMRGQGGRGRTAYAASKAGMWGLMVDITGVLLPVDGGTTARSH